MNTVVPSSPNKTLKIVLVTSAVIAAVLVLVAISLFYVRQPGGISSNKYNLAEATTFAEQIVNESAANMDGQFSSPSQESETITDCYDHSLFQDGDTQGVPNGRKTLSRYYRLQSTSAESTENQNTMKQYWASKGYKVESRGTLSVFAQNSDGFSLQFIRSTNGTMSIQVVTPCVRPD